MPIGKTKGREIKTNRDGGHAVMLLQVEVSDPEDIQTIEFLTSGGEQFSPPDDSRLFLVQAGKAYQIAVACDDGIVPTVGEGERKVYSISGGSISAVAYFKDSGEVELNGGGGTAVEFARLKAKLDALEAQLLAHVHPGVIAGGASTGASVTPFDVDITAAESPTVEIP